MKKMSGKPVSTHIRQTGHLCHHHIVVRDTVDVLVLTRVVRQHVQLSSMDIRCIYLKTDG